MWKIYAALGSGVAIESNVGRLQASIPPEPRINVHPVRYKDFHRDPVDKGQTGYFMRYKRLSFKHEREVRALVRLKTPGEGESIKCDLETLVICVHISPFAGIPFQRAIEDRCFGALRGQRFNVQKSRLLDPPSYDLSKC
jgi:hypothetical protein